MKHFRAPAALALHGVAALAWPVAALAQAAPADVPVRYLGVVTVNSGQPTSLSAAGLHG